MGDALPDPLVPSDVDLTDFPFMPLHVERLRRSKAWLLAKKTPELGFYMLNLWAMSWHESPPASLEDDDEVLADAAMCKESRWAKVREQVLRGWVKCADGRLYHPIVAEVALTSWQSKVDQRKRTAAATAAREANRRYRDDARDEQRNVERNDQRDVDVTFTKGSKEKLREVEVKGSIKPDVERTPNVVAPINGSHVGIEKVSDSKAKPDPGQQWSSMPWVTATATTMGVQRRVGESDDDFTDRTKTALDRRVASAAADADKRARAN